MGLILVEKETCGKSRDCAAPAAIDSRSRVGLPTGNNSSREGSAFDMVNSRMKPGLILRYWK